MVYADGYVHEPEYFPAVEGKKEILHFRKLARCIHTADQ